MLTFSISLRPHLSPTHISHALPKSDQRAFGNLLNLENHNIRAPDFRLWLRPGSLVGAFRPLVESSGVSVQAAARGLVPGGL